MQRSERVSLGLMRLRPRRLVSLRLVLRRALQAHRERLQLLGCRSCVDQSSVQQRNSAVEVQKLRAHCLPRFRSFVAQKSTILTLQSHKKALFRHPEGTEKRDFSTLFRASN